jgi:hypothetical protein
LKHRLGPTEIQFSIKKGSPGKFTWTCNSGSKGYGCCYQPFHQERVAMAGDFGNIFASIGSWGWHPKQQTLIKNPNIIAKPHFSR